MFIEPIIRGERRGWIEVICGSMFSGKTEELIRRLKRVKFANLKVEIFKPAIDIRYGEMNIVSHDTNAIPSTPIDNSQKILLMAQGADVIGIDEAQFFDDQLPYVCDELAYKGIRVIVAGLDMDYTGKPFGQMPFLMAKLKEQADQHADATEMLATLQLLQNELQNLQPVEAGVPIQARRLGTSKVAVVMPASMQTQYDKYGPKPADPPVTHEKETVLVEKGSVSIVQENGQLDMVFDPMNEIPTLSNQVRSNYPKNKNGEPESLNDRLREAKTELIEVLKETPVKDLRKAIGINDRFLFINELFRGDESMYERSIKTINSFNIFAEAEYWINRELKVKLGWNVDDSAVIHFDQLIKRRFS